MTADRATTVFRLFDETRIWWFLPSSVLRCVIFNSTVHCLESGTHFLFCSYEISRSQKMSFKGFVWKLPIESKSACVLWMTVIDAKDAPDDLYDDFQRWSLVLGTRHSDTYGHSRVHMFSNIFFFLFPTENGSVPTFASLGPIPTNSTHKRTLTWFVCSVRPSKVCCGYQKKKKKIKTLCLAI